MSINSTLTSVNTSASTKVSKSSGADNTKKSSDASFKDEMNKVTTTENVEQKETKEVKEATDNASNTNEVSSDKKSQVNNNNQEVKPETDKNQSNHDVKNNQNELNELSKLEILNNNLGKNELNLIKNQQIIEGQVAFENDKVQNAEGLTVVQNKPADNLKSDKTINKMKDDKTDILTDILDLNNSQIEGTYQQACDTDDNFNTDTLKTEEADIIAGNVIFNNALSNFDINNNELSNDIQQMINTSAPKVTMAKSVEFVGKMNINSSKNISMTQSDAEFFVNLTQTQDVSVENIVAQATEMVQNGAEVKEVANNVKVSQALLDALTESREKNQPVRIDFDRDVSVILRVNKDGSLAANFIPGDKAVEQYLRNNIEALKNTFNENDLPYSDLSYSSRGNKQQKENQRDKQQQQQK